MLNFYVTKKDWGGMELVPEKESHSYIHTRTDFLYSYRDGVYINGVLFDPKTVIAKTKKKHTILESFITTLITLALLLFFGKDVSTAKYWIGGGIAWIFGLLMGRLRIETQQKRAMEFNKSPIL